jgi:hypothetical protein
VRPLLVVLLALVLAAPASADRGLLIGVADNSATWASRPRAPLTIAQILGLRAVRVSVHWHRGQSSLNGDQRISLTRAITSAWGLRIVLSVTGWGADAPGTAAGREQFCTFARDVLRRFPTVDDVAVWNEPNGSFFWRPVSPARYEALLARCWDVLHAYRPSVNVIGASTSARGGGKGSMAPATFVRRVGAAYRASGRKQRILDTIGHHPYPDTNSEPPWQPHPTGRTIGQGDLGKLDAAYADAFRGTVQPLPGYGGVAVWWLETGYQSRPPEPKRSLYSGRENVRAAEPEAQGTNLASAIRLAYCQPHVGAFFNFQLFDESNLGGWQSGILYADGSAKPAYGEVKKATTDIAAGALACS